MRAELIERGGGRMSDELAASAAFLARVRDDDHEPTPLRVSPDPPLRCLSDGVP